MKFTETLERWFGNPRSDSDSDSETENSTELTPTRLRNICNELGDDVDPEALEMLASRGLEDDAIAELIQATNMLSCRVMGHLDLEINKMFAEGVLIRYGFADLDQFNEEVRHFRERLSLRH